MRDVSRGCAGYEENFWRNWHGNVIFGGAPNAPASIAELRQLIVNNCGPIRVVGRGHSFTPLAECTGGTLISLHHINKVLDYEKPSLKNNYKGFITVEGGATYTDIAKYLVQHGNNTGALRNLPSCTQFTVAGAIATGTHGSGIDHQNLAADVRMLQFVQADGTLVEYNRHESEALLEGCRIHLGCLGVICKLSLDVVPYFEVETVCYLDVPLKPVIDNLSKLWKTCDSLSVWTSGFGHGHGKDKCWITFRHFVKPDEKRSMHTTMPTEILGDTGRRCDPTVGLPRYCDPYGSCQFFPTGRGPWYESLTLTFYDLKETPMTLTDIQAEFFVPLEHANEALMAMSNVSREWTFSSPWGHPGPAVKGMVDAMEFRQVKGGDGGWLSPHPVDSLGIHISFNGDQANRQNVQEILVPAIEQALAPFHPRAHWGKLACTLYQPDRVQQLFKGGLNNFRDLCHRHDPTGKFCNAHINKSLFHHQSTNFPRSKL